MRTWFTAALLLLLGFHGAAKADGSPVETCDVLLDMRMSVYMVTVAGVPYRNKRYLTFADAAKLRDVLRNDGQCGRVAPPKRCELKLLAAGNYAIMRDGVNFDPYARLRTLKQAQRHARSLVKHKLCKKVG